MSPVVGIMFGSTRIKAVAIDESGTPVASGSHERGNAFRDGVWTYSLNDAETVFHDAFARLKADYVVQTGNLLRCLPALGVAGMMHGYLPSDREGDQLFEFRSWRNTITQET